jgi:hypothetical protein
MSESVQKIIEFIISNLIGIGAFIVSVFALVMSFKAYRHGSRANLKINVEGNWRFDFVVQYQDKFENFKSDIFIKNVGGVRTTLESLSIMRFFHNPFQRGKRILLAPQSNGFEFIGNIEHSRDISWISFKNIVIEPGVRISLEKIPHSIFDFLSQNGLFDVSKEDQGLFQLIIKHTFREEKSNLFRIILSKSSLRFLRLGRNENAFIEDQKKQSGVN